MNRLALAAGAATLLSSCASVERVERLEARVGAVETQLSSHGTRLDGAEAASRQVHDHTAELERRATASEAALDTLRSGVSSLEARDTALSQRVTALEGVINWSGKFTAAIAQGARWQVVYANSTGESQKLRLRMLGGSGAVKVRITEIARIGRQLGEADVAAPEWDMSGAGSQRWLRIGCGQELGALATEAPARFEILISKDSPPVRC